MREFYIVNKTIIAVWVCILKRTLKNLLCMKRHKEKNNNVSILKNSQQSVGKIWENTLGRFIFFQEVIYLKTEIHNLINVSCCQTKAKRKASQASVATSLKRNRNFIINQHEEFIVQSSICPSLLYTVWGIPKNEKSETLPHCKTTND